MSTRKVLALLFMFFTTSLLAQYIKFPLDKDHFWYERKLSVITDHEYDLSYRISYVSDSTINGLNYQLMSLNSISYVKIGGHVYESKFLLRQDTLLKRLYGLGASQDILLYDFKRQVGDTSAGSALLSIDTVLLSDGKKHLRQKYHGAPHISNNPYYVIEGVGCMNGLLDYKGAADFEQKSWLTCLFDIKLNQPVYKNSQSVCSGDVGLKTFYDCQPKIAFNASHRSLSLQLCDATPHIEIIDVYGRTVKVIEAGIGTFDLSVSDLPDGFYLLRAFGPTTERYGRFIKSQ